VSKERARRREEREREVAAAAAKRAAQRERERRRREWRAALSRLLPARASRPSGILARRAQIRSSLLALVLLIGVIAVWVARTDWAARLGVIVVCVLLYPVLRALLFPRP
jgi:Flp pilus assembly protein TadB